MLLACLSALCFGAAVVASKRGLAYRDPRAGAVISVPTATLLLLLVTPFFFDASGFVVAAALLLAERIPPKAVLASVGVVIGITVLSWTRAGEPRRFTWALALPLAGAMIRGLAQALAKAGLVLWPNPFAATLISYVVSSGMVGAANRFRVRPREGGKLWFMLTGALNGAAVLFMYSALSVAPVSTVAPIVATFPLVTALLSVAIGEETLRLRLIGGSALIVAAIVYLVAG